MSKKSKSCEIRKNPRFSKLKSKVLDILVQARDIVRDKRYWTSGEWGVDRDGLPAASSKSVGTDYNKACRVCAEGAIACSARTFEQYRNAVEYVDRVVQKDKNVTYGGILMVNDEDGQKPTVAYFTKAIRKLRAEQKSAAKGSK
jgi:hypothetical protein